MIIIFIIIINISIIIFIKFLGYTGIIYYIRVNLFPCPILTLLSIHLTV